MSMPLVFYIHSLQYKRLYIFCNTDHLSVLFLQTDFEKDVDIACRSGKEQMVSY